MRLGLLRTHSIRPTRWLGDSGLVVDSDHHTVGCVERALENFRDLLPRLPPCLDNTRAGALMLCMVGDLRVHKMQNVLCASEGYEGLTLLNFALEISRVFSCGASRRVYLR